MGSSCRSTDVGVRAALAFVVGCLLAPWFPSLPGLIPLIVAAAAAGVACAFRSTRLVGVFFLGALWFLTAAQWQLHGEWPASRAGETVAITGTVADLPRRVGESVQFTLRVDADASPQGVPRRVRVRWYRPFQRIEPGSRWRLPVALEPPAGRDNPGGFDYERYLFARRIGGSARVRGDPVLLTDEPRGHWLDRQRQRLADIIQSETVDRDVAALERALGVADRSAIRPELADRLRQTGTAHLLAISGLHIGMVAGLVGALAGWLSAPLTLLWSRLDRRRLGILAGLGAAVGYAGLAGFTLPTQRALVMLGVLAFALLVRRSVAPGRALLLALLAVLVFDPLSPLSTGFWLSFAAVSVLIWAFAWRPSSASGWLTGLVRAQLIILVGLLPLNVGLFGQIVPGALLANLLAIPLVGVIVLPALLADLATMLAGWPATAVGDIADAGLSLLLATLDILHGVDGAFLPLAGGAAWTVALAAVGAYWLIAPPGWPARWLGLVLMLPLLWPSRPGLDDDVLEAWFLDVGNGLAVLVRTAEDTVLYDTGPGDGQGGDAISHILPDALREMGTAELDRVVISHDHRGYAGGAASVIGEGVAVHANRSEASRPCVAGAGWSSGSYRFRILHPSDALPDLGGNSSCVLQVSGPGGSLLLTGGIDSDVEARLVALRHGPPADVLQLPSGGHRDGSSRVFLEAVSPALAVVSVARYDRYARVHAETRRRLESLGIDWLKTGRCGAIRVRLQPGRPPAVDSMATRPARFWKPHSGCP